VRDLIVKMNVLALMWNVCDVCLMDDSSKVYIKVYRKCDLLSVILFSMHFLKQLVFLTDFVRAVKKMWLPEIICVFLLVY